MKFATCMAVVFCSAVSAQAAQPVSNDSLKSVGLSNIVVMSDAQGTQVRAKGFAATAGGDFATSNSRSGPGNTASAGGINGAIAISGPRKNAEAVQVNGVAANATSNTNTNSSYAIGGGYARAK
ncbi:MAG: hypothetical protein NTW75_09125 [Planctomycetales bacterium]|nr:hypothetical protein [Planctomycetales bacterium]